MRGTRLPLSLFSHVAARRAVRVHCRSCPAKKICCPATTKDPTEGRSGDSPSTNVAPLSIGLVLSNGRLELAKGASARAC